MAQGFGGGSMFRRQSRYFTAQEVDDDSAAEMAAVGIIPSKEGPNEEPIGHTFIMAGQRFMVTGYTTKEEFLEAVDKAGLSGNGFETVPDGLYFQKVSTD